MRLAALALLALAACSEPRANGEASAKATPTSAPPKAAQSDCRRVTFGSVPLTHCVADPARHTIRTALDAPDGDPARSLAVLQDMQAEPGKVAFATNGGMFDDNGRPIGYYVENGERRKTLNRNQGGGNFHLLPNGVFYGSARRWAVKTTEAFAESVTKRPEFGTQSGPMLVIAGKLHPRISEDGPSHYVRNAVGVDSEGRAHFVISEAPLSLGKLARYYRDVLEVPNALYLDGNVSALWDPAVGRIDSSSSLGPLIVVEKRAGQP